MVITVDSVELEEFIEDRERIENTEDVGDYSDHMGVGVKCSKDVATAIRVCVLLFKLSIIPVSFVYEIIKPNTVPPGKEIKLSKVDLTIHLLQVVLSLSVQHSWQQPPSTC